MPFRGICTTAIRSARPRTTAFIKKYPVTLRFQYPSWETPTLHEFSSAKDITEFLSTPEQFLYEPLTGKAIRPKQVDKIDPNITYEVAGSGLPYREKGLSRDQVWDRDFEMKTALALKDMLEKKDLKVTHLPRVIKGNTGKDISEWQAVYQLSDGGVVFLETKFRMSKDHINVQSKRVLRSLKAMRKSPRAQLYLAAFYWPDDEDCISHARNKGYGVLQPNGSDLTVCFEAKDLDFE